ncbi:MAG: hypothetical protein WD295_04155 [Bacteroidota bacterium]
MFRRACVCAIVFLGGSRVIAQQQTWTLIVGSTGVSASVTPLDLVDSSLVALQGGMAVRISVDSIQSVANGSGPTFLTAGLIGLGAGAVAGVIAASADDEGIGRAGPAGGAALGGAAGFLVGGGLSLLFGSNTHDLRGLDRKAKMEVFADLLKNSPGAVRRESGRTPQP